MDVFVSILITAFNAYHEQGIGVFLKFTFWSDWVFVGALIAVAIAWGTYVLAKNTGTSEKSATVAAIAVGIAGVVSGIIISAATVAAAPIIIAAGLGALLAAGAFFGARAIAKALGADSKTADAVGCAAAGAVAGAIVGAAVGAAVGGPVGAVVGAVVGGVVGAVAGFFSSWW